MRVMIVAGGLEPSCDLLKNTLKKVDTVIGVDKGCNYLVQNNIFPQYIIGDFDSVNKENITLLEKRGAKRFEYNPEKDYTDSEIAMEFAIEELQCSEIVLLGATGKRIDHFLGNIGILKRALDKGVRATMVDHYNEIFIINEGQKIFGEEGDYISFQAYCECVENFTIKNAKYGLNNYSLRLGDPLTISNEFLVGPVEVSFDFGTVLVIKSKD
ncbi:MAG: thiamine diphosphokinase [Clostridium sp.]